MKGYFNATWMCVYCLTDEWQCSLQEAEIILGNRDGEEPEQPRHVLRAKAAHVDATRHLGMRDPTLADPEYTRADARAAREEKHRLARANRESPGTKDRNRRRRGQDNSDEGRTGAGGAGPRDHTPRPRRAEEGRGGQGPPRAHCGAASSSTQADPYNPRQDAATAHSREPARQQRPWVPGRGRHGEYEPRQREPPAAEDPWEGWAGHSHHEYGSWQTGWDGYQHTHETQWDTRSWNQSGSARWRRNEGGGGRGGGRERRQDRW